VTQLECATETSGAGLFELRQEPTLVFAREWGGASPDRDRLVTLVIPSYNHERFVRHAIQSALDQDHSPMEIIVLDDGSQDATAAEVRRTLEAYSGDKRIRFYRQTNRGVSRTLNFALALSEGKYIQFLASDDAYLPDKTRLCVAALESAPASVCAVYTDGYLVNEDGQRIRRCSDKYLPPPSRHSVYENLLLGNWIPALGVLYRTATLREVGGFDESLAVEDYDLLLRLSKRFDIRGLRERCFEYRWHATNFSKDAARMEAQFSLISAKHPDLSAYRTLQTAVGDRSWAAVFSSLSLLNIRVLGRSVVRSIQKRHEVRVESTADLLWVVARKALQVLLGLGRARLQRLFGLRLGRGSRVHGRIQVRGWPGNVRFGKNVRVLGDLTIVTHEGISPGQIEVEDDVVLERNATLFSMGGNIVIGSGSFVGPGVMIQANGDVHVGRHCMFASNSSVYANNHLTDDIDLPFARQGNRFVGIHIQDNCWIGAGVTVLDGTQLGSNSVVGANCVLRGVHPENSRLVARGVLPVSATTGLSCARD